MKKTTRTKKLKRTAATRTRPSRSVADGLPTARRRLEERWTPALIRPGYTAIPNAIIEYQHLLGLDALDLAILVHLAHHWRDATNPPWPSKKRLGERLRIDPRSVQRRIAAMEKRGLILREAREFGTGRKSTNAYHLGGLIERSTPYANRMMEERSARAVLRRATARPGLRPIEKTEEP